MSDTPTSNGPETPEFPTEIRKRAAERLVHVSGHSLKETSVALGSVSVRHLVDVLDSLRCWAGLSKGNRTREDIRMVEKLYQNIESMAKELEHKNRFKCDWRADLPGLDKPPVDSGLPPGDGKPKK